MRNNHAQRFGNCFWVGCCHAFFWVEEIKLNLGFYTAMLTARSRRNRKHARKLEPRQSIDLRNYSKLPRLGNKLTVGIMTKKAEYGRKAGKTTN